MISSSEVRRRIIVSRDLNEGNGKNESDEILDHQAEKQDEAIA